MKLLLHACCADCCLKFLEAAQVIKSTKVDTNLVNIYYYNPNIHPRAEYTARLKAMQQVATEKGVKIIIPDWKPKDYFVKIKPTLPSLEEGRQKDFINKSSRCVKCWNLRLEATAKYAHDNGYDTFSSTLVTSEYQDQENIENIAVNMANKYKIKFWKPKEMCCDLKTSGFYKQFFCGCVYSLEERYIEKYKK